MADSIHTKQALARALKELIREQPYEKISIQDICRRCGMSRKSFYYHFRDKYDLTNWIFDWEFLDLLEKNGWDRPELHYSYEEGRRRLIIVCQYFYDNRSFYHRVLQVEGQNSFSSHLRDFLISTLRYQVTDLAGDSAVPQMVFDFLADGLMCAMERWLLEKECATAEEFVGNLMKLTNLLLLGLKRRVEDDPKWLEEIFEIQ